MKVAPVSETKSENEVQAQNRYVKMPFLNHHSAPLFDFADMSALGSPRFILTVDTEEEFDWNGPFSRQGYGTEHLKAVPKFQDLCDRFGIKPCYMVDYPIMEDAFGVDMLSGFVHAGRAEIGVQLHPWVNPPFDEMLSPANSYACNLPPDLERAKLTNLYNRIVGRTGIKPDSYRAGRYGAGAATADILVDLGISIDSSVRARFDYSEQGGPNYTHHPVHPYWIQKGALLELPLTTIFAGAMRSAGNVVYGEWFGSHAARSVLARSSMIERIALTPEGIPLEKAIEGIDLALQEGVSIINLSFHSPSLAAGCTPYVRTQEHLDDLYDWFIHVFQHLLENGVRPANMAEIRTASQLNCPT
ncbi:WalW protein [Sphingorhabdus sp. IMCC26285]|uniref:WalW protein n=2 Tax=Sphingorhabdus profundilacus TaxID=2509718 RepID=A0A6I4LUP8_9SPHN|nr:WalW protein [Sphingorhabdus profundilacus]